ncbi:MAG: arginase family protein, partial [bacterium]|nr:arginase family protein [bacterium]
GDHSISVGAFKGIVKLFNSSEVTILQIDAHPDLRENTLDYKDVSNEFDHACTMRRACEMGFKTVQVGIRTISVYDYEFIKKNNLTVFEWGRGTTSKIKDIIKSIKTKNVYLTFDMDGLDPSVAPGTGTPVPGGLSWDYASELIRELILKKNLIGADIVEISPTKNDILTPYVAAHLCYNIMSYKLMKNKNILKFYNQ